MIIYRSPEADIELQAEGVSVGEQPIIDFIEGLNIALGVVEDELNGKFELTIANTPGELFTINVQTDTYTLTTNDRVVVCNKSTAFIVTLPAATGSGQSYTIKNVNTGVVTVEGDGADTIDGVANQAIYQWESMQVVDFSTNSWIIL